MSSLHGCQLYAPVGWIADKTSVPEPTRTNRYIFFSSHHPTKVKEGIVRGLADRAIKVCSDWETLDRELQRIATAMEGNGYPKQFTEKAISRQLKRPAAGKLERVINEPDQPKMEIARIPYVNGLSQEIRRIAHMVGVRYSFFMLNTLRSLYQAKDSLPQETMTNAVYSVTCKTCDAEYIGETKRVDT